MPPEVKLGVVLISLAMLSGCGDMAKVPILAGTGPQPTLEAPRPSLIPTINIAPASGWPIGMVPIAAPGTQVQAFAKGLALEVVEPGYQTPPVPPADMAQTMPDPVEG